jgi:hypothetical protein
VVVLVQNDDRHMELTIEQSCGCTPEMGSDLLSRSSLYREFLAEREEILRHKWIESEKAGRDIGFENALVSWMVHHRAQWRRDRRSLLARSGA